MLKYFEAVYYFMFNCYCICSVQKISCLYKYKII